MFSELAADLASLDDDGVAARLRELELTARRLEAEMAATVAEAERRKLAHVDGHGTVRGLLRGRLSWSNDQCTRRIRLARLVEREPTVGEALVTGSLGVAQAEELAAAAANPRCGRDIGPFLPLFLTESRRLSFADFRTMVRRWENLADVDGAHREARSTHAARRATLVESGGAIHLAAFGGALDGAAMAEIFERSATPSSSPTSTRPAPSSVTRTPSRPRCPARMRNAASTRCSPSSWRPRRPRPGRSHPNLW